MDGASAASTSRDLVSKIHQLPEEEVFWPAFPEPEAARLLLGGHRHHQRLSLHRPSVLLQGLQQPRRVLSEPVLHDVQSERYQLKSSIAIEISVGGDCPCCTKSELHCVIKPTDVS